MWKRFKPNWTEMSFCRNGPSFSFEYWIIENIKKILRKSIMYRIGLHTLYRTTISTFEHITRLLFIRSEELHYKMIFNVPFKWINHFIEKGVLLFHCIPWINSLLISSRKLFAILKYLMCMMSFCIFIDITRWICRKQVLQLYMRTLWYKIPKLCW